MVKSWAVKLSATQVPHGGETEGCMPFRRYEAMLRYCEPDNMAMVFAREYLSEVYDND